MATSRRSSAPQLGLPAWAQVIPAPRDPLPAEVEEFLTGLRLKGRPATTVRGYRQDLRKFVAFIAARPGPAPFLARLDRATLRAYQRELLQVLPDDRTRARALVALRMLLRHLADETLVAEDLSRFVDVPRYLTGDPHPLETSRAARLLASLPTESFMDLRDRALVYFLIDTGCRVSEACGVDRDVLREDGFRVLGKGSKYRTVYLTPAGWAAVDDYLEARGVDDSPALWISLSSKDCPGGRAAKSNRLTPEGARVVLAGLRRRCAGDEDLAELLAELRSPHVARHTAATTLLEATDGDVRLVQEVLGHSTLETLRVYTEITDRRKRAAYQRLGEYRDGHA